MRGEPMGPPEVNLRSCLMLTAASALRSEQAAQGFIPLGLEYLQGWRLHSLSLQPAVLRINVFSLQYPVCLAERQSCSPR